MEAMEREVCDHFQMLFKCIQELTTTHLCLFVFATVIEWPGQNADHDLQVLAKNGPERSSSAMAS